MRRDYFRGILESHTRLIPPIDGLMTMPPNASVEPVPIPNGSWTRPAPGCRGAALGRGAGL
jgi:hypothetical protein